MKDFPKTVSALQAIYSDSRIVPIDEMEMTKWFYLTGQ